MADVEHTDEYDIQLDAGEAATLNKVFRFVLAEADISDVRASGRRLVRELSNNLPGPNPYEG